MEKLVINIPETKSKLVKQILKELGVTFQKDDHQSICAYRQKLVKVSIWPKDDIRLLEESKKAFGNLEPGQW